MRGEARGEGGGGERVRGREGWGERVGFVLAGVFVLSLSSLP